MQLTNTNSMLIAFVRQSLESIVNINFFHTAPFLVQFFLKPMMDAMPYVDILFGNETVSSHVFFCLVCLSVFLILLSISVVTFLKFLLKSWFNQGLMIVASYIFC